MKTRIAITSIIFILELALHPGLAEPDEEQHFIKAREEMVEAQIMARGVKDSRVLSAMRKVKRHLFVPPAYRRMAYQDSPLPIGEGQTISQPYIVAVMTELLALKDSDKVLEVGTGSGYQAAVLAELAKEVYSVEIIESLAVSAEKLLKELGYRNIHVKCGDGYLGWPEDAPFDAIIVTCASGDIPQPLVEQLAEGGRIVIPIGETPDWQELKFGQKVKGKLVTTSILPVRFVPLLRK